MQRFKVSVSAMIKLLVQEGRVVVPRMRITRWGSIERKDQLLSVLKTTFGRWVVTNTTSSLKSQLSSNMTKTYTNESAIKHLFYTKQQSNTEFIQGSTKCRVDRRNVLRPKNLLFSSIFFTTFPRA